jgi:hypothetical protein
MKGREHLQDLGIDGKIISEGMALREMDGKVRTGCIWLRIRTIVRLQ